MNINMLARIAVTNGTPIVFDGSTVHYRVRCKDGKWETRDGGTWIAVSGRVMVEDEQGKLYLSDVHV